MKKIAICLSIIFSFCFISIAQHFRGEDTVVVFRATTVPGSLNKYFPFKNGNELSWVDSNGISHKSKITKIAAEHLLSDSDTIYPAEVKELLLSGPLVFVPGEKKHKNIPVETDSSRRFRVMTTLEFEKLAKTEFIIKAQQNNDPFYKHISPEKYAADMDQKNYRRRSMFAALDTCPVHFGIKTNLIRDLTNEINLYVELPVKRSFCIDLGAGILYSTPDPKPYHLAGFLTDLVLIRNRNLPSFDHSYLYRKGFTFELIPKFFLSKKKHLYLGPQLGFHYYYYKDKWIFLNADGSDYYHVSYYAFQSEKSIAINLNALVGVQTPQIKRFIFDAFFSIGATYRGGIVSRSIRKEYYHEWTKTFYFDPPIEFNPDGFELSVQLGFKIGYRFGKAKLIK